MTNEQIDQAIIAVGKEAESFIKSSLGRALTKRAQDEIKIAEQDFRAVDPTDSKAITEIQNRIFRAEAFIVWLAEIYQEGHNLEKENERGEFPD